MSDGALLTPNDVAALPRRRKPLVEKALEQKALTLPHGGRANRRLLPLHAVALAVAVKSLGRRLTVNDKKRVARELARLSPAGVENSRDRSGAVGIRSRRLDDPGGREGAPFGQRAGSSLFVSLASDEMALLIEWLWTSA